MVRIGAVVLNVSDAGRAGTFWSRALGYQRGTNPDFLLPGAGGGPELHLDQTDRTHLELWASNASEQRAEVDRLQTLGATRVEWDYPDDADFPGWAGASAPVTDRLASPWAVRYSAAVTSVGCAVAARGCPSEPGR